MSRNANHTITAVRFVPGQVVALTGLAGLALMASPVAPELYASAALTVTAVGAILGAIALAAHARLQKQQAAARPVPVRSGRRNQPEQDR